MDWLKLGYAALVIGLIIFIFPAVKYWQKNSPKAKLNDWLAFLLPIGLVSILVIGLIWLI